MNLEAINKWLDEEYGCSYTRLEELHDFYFEKYCDLKKENKKQKEVIDRVNKYLHTRGIQQCYNGRHYRGLDGLQVQVLEDILNEVSE